MIEDIIVISLLATIQSSGTSGNISINEIMISVGTTLAFIVGVLVIGLKTVPRLIDVIARTNHHDVLIVVAVGVAFALAFVSSHLGISVAAGAFFAGVLVAESKSHSVTSVLATPVKDIFAAMFFVSVGALMDFKLIPLFIAPAPVLIAVSIGAKFVTVFLSARAQRIVQDNLCAHRYRFVIIWRRVGTCCGKGWRRYWSNQFHSIANGRNYDHHYHIYFPLCHKIRMEGCTKIKRQIAAAITTTTTIIVA